MVDLDLRRVRYFAAVAAQLHFGRAAEELNLGQSVLSRQIVKLESQLGAALFHRDRPLRLTDAGALFFEDAKRLLQYSDASVAVIRRLQQGQFGRVRVGFTGTALNELCPRIVERYRENFPGVSLTISELLQKTLLDEIELGNLDVGFVRHPVARDGVAEEPVLTESYSAVLYKGHPLFSEKTLNLAQLAKEDFVTLDGTLNHSYRDYLVGACRRSGFAPRIVQEVNTGRALLALVAARVGIAVVAYSHRLNSRRDLRFVPIPELLAITAMTWSPRRASDSVRHFVDLARQICAKRF